MAGCKYIPGFRKVQDILGCTFGRLTVVKHLGPRNGQHWWLCVCVCGKEKAVAANHLRSGRTKSCGCLHDESSHKSNRKHGLSKTRIEKIRWHMLDRCRNPNNEHYEDYGGRGIVVCERWINSLIAFAEDMGLPPTPQHSIDRIDNNGNYEPGNCRWATQTEQMRNTRVNTLLTFNGKTQCLKAWADEIGIRASTLCQRLYVLGWSVQRTLATPTGK